MASIPSRASSRIVAGIKRFQPILTAAKARDINESDTVLIVTDMLHDVFGYDKYTEITSEHSVKSTFVDLAIKVDGSLVLLLELKAIGMDLKNAYVKQAVDYAANQGVDWVVLSSGVLWRVYRVQFTKPIDHELVYEFNFLELNPKNEDHLELLWMLSRESWQKESLKEYHAQRQAMNRFVLGALLQSDPVLDVVRREVRRVSPGIRIETAEIAAVLQQEVIKREVLEGDKAEAAKRLVSRAANRALRSAKSTEDDEKESTTSDSDEVAVTKTPTNPALNQAAEHDRG
ncbi:MAG TPA: hypothetical protein VFG68_07075 [Fimbriiglobus sp.]|nr:hypothetical protein [Fimbriiglobus sp.]